ncbi:uncharacterized protein [Antennarius striatus]|uniref:uncharacterized protein isoform X2 n=1 Tax=Antennarius striatus TaxID=241820 RepID=UPI0035B2BF94
MSLLEYIKAFDPNVARVLEEANLSNNVDIWALTRGDLHELFPGHEQIKLRKEIFRKIHKENPSVLIRELKEFIMFKCGQNYPINSEVFVDDLQNLKDLKIHINELQEFLDVHIGILENSTKDSNHGKDSMLDTPSSLEMRSNRTPQRDQVTYCIVGGDNTFGAQLQLMEKVKSQDEIQFLESNEDHSINVVFCPITSRIGTDVEDALTEVKDDKPVILVVMHHTFGSDHVQSVKPSFANSNVVLYVEVFFHMSKPGLLTCKRNNAAAYKIQQKLLEYRTKKFGDIGKSTIELGVEVGFM